MHALQPVIPAIQTFWRIWCRFDARQIGSNRSFLGLSILSTSCSKTKQNKNIVITVNAYPRKHDINFSNEQNQIGTYWKSFRYPQINILSWASHRPCFIHTSMAWEKAKHINTISMPFLDIVTNKIDFSFHWKNFMVENWISSKAGREYCPLNIFYL